VERQQPSVASAPARLLVVGTRCHAAFLLVARRPGSLQVSQPAAALARVLKGAWQVPMPHSQLAPRLALLPVWLQAQLAASQL